MMQGPPTLFCALSEWYCSIVFPSRQHHFQRKPPLCTAAAYITFCIIASFPSFPLFTSFHFCQSPFSKSYSQGKISSEKFFWFSSICLFLLPAIPFLSILSSLFLFT